MFEPLWTSAEISAATGGEAASAFAATGVSIDTRTLQPGDLFVALAGVRDGHEFIDQALGQGAPSGAVATKPGPGAHHRRRHPGRAGTDGLGGARPDASSAPSGGDWLGGQDQRHPGHRRGP